LPNGLVEDLATFFDIGFSPFVFIVSGIAGVYWKIRNQVNPQGEITKKYEIIKCTLFPLV